MIAAKLDVALRAVCPIIGVSLGEKYNKTTWRIDFSPDATAEQQKAAKQVLDGFDADSAKLAEAQADARRATDNDEVQTSRMDNSIMMLLDATPAQRVAWARTNFPSLTQPEQNKLGMLLTMVAIALRPQVR